MSTTDNVWNFSNYDSDWYELCGFALCCFLFEQPQQQYKMLLAMLSKEYPLETGSSCIG